MSEPMLEALTRRLDRLEREIRLWRIAASVSLAALLIAAAPARQTADSVQAKEFILVDRAGNVRASLGVNPHDVTIFQVNSSRAGSLFLSPDALGIDDGHGQGVSLTAFGVSVGDVRIGALEGKRGFGPLASLSTSGLRFTNQDGRVIWEAP